MPIMKNVTLFNSTYLKDEIQNFLKLFKIRQSYVLFSLVHPGILERVISLHVETPQEHHLQQDQNPKPLVWDYLSLGYNRKTGKTHYYICGITREQLFHYQLLALITGINCIGIIPQRAALLKASNFLYPDNPELGSIANHAALQNYLQYSLEKTSADKIFCNYAEYQDKKALFESLGLFFAGNQIYERY